MPLLISLSGGVQINGLGATDIDNQTEFQNSTTLGGLNLEFHERISKHYGRLDRLNEVAAKKLKDPDVWRFESRVAEKIISDWLNEHPSVHITKVNPDINETLATQFHTPSSPDFAKTMV